MDAWVECTVSLGQFSGEYAVRFPTAEGRTVSLFSPKEYLELEEEPIGGKSVEGQLQVEIVETSGPLLLIRLPRPTLENGPYVTVEERRVRQEA